MNGSLQYFCAVWLGNKQIHSNDDRHNNDDDGDDITAAAAADNDNNKWLQYWQHEAALPQSAPSRWGIRAPI